MTCPTTTRRTLGELLLPHYPVGPQETAQPALAAHILAELIAALRKTGILRLHRKIRTYTTPSPEGLP